MPCTIVARARSRGASSGSPPPPPLELERCRRLEGRALPAAELEPALGGERGRRGDAGSSTKSATVRSAASRAPRSQRCFAAARTTAGEHSADRISREGGTPASAARSTSAWAAGPRRRAKRLCASARRPDLRQSDANLRWVGRSTSGGATSSRTVMSCCQRWSHAVRASAPATSAAAEAAAAAPAAPNGGSPLRARRAARPHHHPVRAVRLAHECGEFPIGAAPRRIDERAPLPAAGARRAHRPVEGALRVPFTHRTDILRHRAHRFHAPVAPNAPPRHARRVGSQIRRCPHLGRQPRQVLPLAERVLASAPSAQ